jgi:peptidoglycan/LPS O-acetylase OafA/YrhL
VRQTTAKAVPPGFIVKGFNPYLHGARGLFALIIVVFHAVNSGLPTLPLLSRGLPLFVMRSSESGVELFFGISGIVIVGALRRAKNPYIFAAERATRIFPVLWATIGVIIVLSALTGYEGRHVPGVVAIIENLLAFPPLGPGPQIHPAAWSLSYEMLFYGLCAVAWIFRRWLGLWFIVVIAPIAVALVFFHVRAVLMPAGMAVAWALQHRPSWARYARTSGLGLVIFLMAWEYLRRVNGDDMMQITGFNLAQGDQPIVFVIGVAGALLMFAGLLSGQGLFCRLMGSQPFQFLGTVSYSLYLWHPILMSIIKHFMYVLKLPADAGPLSQLLLFGLTLPCSLIVASISQKLLEQRVTLWLRGVLEPERKRRHLVAPPQTHPAQAGEPVA